MRPRFPKRPLGYALVISCCSKREPGGVRPIHCERRASSWPVAPVTRDFFKSVTPQVTGHGVENTSRLDGKLMNVPALGKIVQRVRARPPAPQQCERNVTSSWLLCPGQ